MPHTVILVGQAQRELAKQMVDRAPPGYVVTVKEQVRSGEANAKMWSMLTDIARAKPMERKHTPDDWKALAMNACGWDCQFQEGLDGRPFPIGFRSSRLSKSQMSSLIDWLGAFGAEHGVKWSDL